MLRKRKRKRKRVLICSEKEKKKKRKSFEIGGSHNEMHSNYQNMTRFARDSSIGRRLKILNLRFCSKTLFWGCLAWRIQIWRAFLTKKIQKVLAVIWNNWQFSTFFNMLILRAHISAQTEYFSNVFSPLESSWLEYPETVFGYKILNSVK